MPGSNICKWTLSCDDDDDGGGGGGGH